MAIDVNQSYYGDYFVICINVKPLCCIPKTKIILYVIIPQLKNKTNQPNKTTVLKILSAVPFPWS